MKTAYWSFWVLLAASTAVAQDPSATITLSPDMTMDPSSVTYPGALLFLGAMLTKWKPTFRIELVDKREE